MTEDIQLVGYNVGGKTAPFGPPACTGVGMTPIVESLPKLEGCIQKAITAGYFLLGHSCRIVEVSDLMKSLN